jgi:hypothetical protein
MSQRQIKNLRKSLPYKGQPKYVPGPVINEETKIQETVSLQVGPNTITYPKVSPIFNEKFNQEAFKFYKQAKKDR